MMEPRGTALLVFINTSPLFKGVSVIIAGIIGLLFSWWMVKKWNEPLSWQFKIFIGLCIYIIIFGSFILIFQPAWWIPPWWPTK